MQYHSCRSVSYEQPLKKYKTVLLNAVYLSEFDINNYEFQILYRKFSRGFRFDKKSFDFGFDINVSEFQL